MQIDPVVVRVWEERLAEVTRLAEEFEAFLRDRLTGLEVLAADEATLARIGVFLLLKQQKPGISAASPRQVRDYLHHLILEAKASTGDAKAQAELARQPEDEVLNNIRRQWHVHVPEEGAQHDS